MGAACPRDFCLRTSSSEAVQGLTRTFCAATWCGFSAACYCSCIPRAALPSPAQSQTTALQHDPALCKRNSKVVALLVHMMGDCQAGKQRGVRIQLPTCLGRIIALHRAGAPEPGGRGAVGGGMSRRHDHRGFI